MDKAFERIALLPFEQQKAYEEDGDMFVEGIITTQDLDRQGEVMVMKGLKNWAEYKRNPVVFWSHQELIGHAVELRREDDHIWVKDKLAKKLPLVQNVIWPLLENGSIRTMSIGFSPANDSGGEERDGIWHWTAWNLYEHSLVPVPANPKTTARIAKSLGLQMNDLMPKTAEEKRQAETEMCHERIERVSGALQGIADIAIHWQRAGEDPTDVLGESYMETLRGARDRLDVLLRAGELGNEPGASAADIESVLRGDFPPMTRERLLRVALSRVGA